MGTIVLHSKRMVDSTSSQRTWIYLNSKGKATYEQIKAYVLEQTERKVSSLYIAQIKKKCGLDVLFADMEVFNGQGNDTETIKTDMNNIYHI